ncbi:LysR family transcriptional regulator [Raoultella sp. BAC10a-01-01]|uniref:LysR family transcriptional regulator n=1 Tax=Raoultella scottii TaxID=3040937 RepID=A0ABU8YZT6_9ENTR
MRKVTHNDLNIFLTIATRQNMSRAAKELGVTPSALSHFLRNIETRLGFRLFNRTTRSIALTDVGLHLFTRLTPIYQNIDDVLDELNTFRSTPSGVLRINAGRPSVQMVLLPIISRFIAAYPEIHIEIAAEDALVDVVSGGFDAGIRFGESLDADMNIIPIGPAMRSAVVATPEFFKRHSFPQHPQDLNSLPCIRLRFPGGKMYRWEFEREGETIDMDVMGPVTLDDMGLIAEASLSGYGLAYVFEELVKTCLVDGRLIRVLQDWCPQYPGLYLYYPGRHQQPAALKSFINFIMGSTERH